MTSITSIDARNGRKVLVGAAMLVALSGAVAQAALVETTGSRAWNSGNVLTVLDTVAEGDAAYTNWNGTGSNRLTTNGGRGSSQSITVSSLSNFRACRDQGSWNPDNCSSWVSP